MRFPLLALLLAALVVSSFKAVNKKGPRLPDAYLNIPAGSFRLAPEDTSLISLPSFYLSRFEVTNKEYREFFAAVAPGLSEAEKENIHCDTAQWDLVPPNSEALVRSYFRHPAFDNYPVVNIKHEGAVAYCQWLQQKLSQQNPGYKIEVQLPTRHEWIWAAMGGRSQAMFPWGNFYLRNRKGEYLCNFKRVDESQIYRNRETGKPEVAERVYNENNMIYTATVKSFYPNDYGLYNMCGNAAEMVAEKGVAVGGSWNDYGGDIHIRSYAAYQTALPTVGFRPLIKVEKL